MGLITFLSDFGEKDHYVASVKAAILHMNPTLRIVDITHQVPCCHLAHASFVMESVFRLFPAGTVHLVAVGADTGDTYTPLAMQAEGHLFVGPDNGILSLIPSQKPSVIVDLSALPQKETTFSALHKYGPATALLASGKSVYDLGRNVSAIKVLKRKQSKASAHRLQGHVIHIDAYGNLITNLHEKDFKELHKNHRKGAYTILFGQEHATQLHSSYDQVDSGECFLLFNHWGYLEIGIKHGHASQALGLGDDTPVSIRFT